MPVGQQHRLDREIERRADPRRPRDQADPEAHGLGEVAIGGIELADATHRERIGPEPGAERAVGEDRQLGRGIVAVEIGRGVGLGEPEPLRLGDRLVHR